MPSYHIFSHQMLDCQAASTCSHSLRRDKGQAGDVCGRGAEASAPLQDTTQIDADRKRDGEIKKSMQMQMQMDNRGYRMSVVGHGRMKQSDFEEMQLETRRRHHWSQCLLLDDHPCFFFFQNGSFCLSASRLQLSEILLIPRK